MRPLQIKATRIAALALALAVLLPVAPAAASEAANPFAPASPAAKSAKGAGKAATGATPAKGAILPSQVTGAKTAKTASTSTSTQESSSGTNTAEIMALVAAGALLVGIAFMILRDARSVAPVTEGLATGGTRNPEGRLRKRRAQAKAARLQRKRHRKR
jgi:hypothetical protein